VGEKTLIVARFTKGKGSFDVVLVKLKNYWGASPCQKILKVASPAMDDEGKDYIRGVKLSHRRSQKEVYTVQRQRKQTSDKMEMPHRSSKGRGRRRVDQKRRIWQFRLI